MKRTRCLTKPKHGVIELAICIRVGNNFGSSATGRLAAILAILRKRFSAYVVLGQEELAPLGEKTLTQWLVDDLIEITICSGHEDLILNDLIDAAIRSTAITSVYVDAADLLQSPANVLKFIIGCLGIANGSTLEGNGKLFQAGKRELLSVSRLKFPEGWHKGLRKLNATCEDMAKNAARAVDMTDKHQDKHTLSPRHLFVTQSGVERLGGLEKFITLPILMGGALLSEFAKITHLRLNDVESEADTSNASSKPWRTITAIRPASSKDQSVVFDIWPAPHKFKKSEYVQANHIVVPRQILVGRRCPVSKDSVLAATSQQAIFIMSNYNKAAYLGAALYGWAMQMHSAITLEVVDDISTDESIQKIRQFRQLLGLNKQLLKLDVIEVKRGTYWIRNLVIARHLKQDVVFFINDSDDVSSALRASLQLGALGADAGREACLFNIVRVDKVYSPLPLNNEVERYGTASLCFKSSLIKKSGYFQNIKKNADTEFIRRINKFFGKRSIPWLRLPAMFQLFDGNNLTADIYQMDHSGGSIAVNLDMRKRHIEIADRHHERLSLKDLWSTFGCDLLSLPVEYSELGNDYLIMKVS